MTRRQEIRWCPLCDVDWGLHGVDDPDDVTPDDCECAARKADILRAFYGAVFR